MNIVILNGDIERDQSSLTKYLDRFTKELEPNHSVKLFHLSKMDLHYCTGCWNCWWKTPGQCSIKDDANEIFKSVIKCDFFIFASPLIAGFTSSVLKKITDRLIVLLHPYIELINGECHHQKRYENYPNFGLILEKDADSDKNDLEIIDAIYDRIAINFHCTKKYMKLIDEHKIEEIIYETCNI